MQDRSEEMFSVLVGDALQELPLHTSFSTEQGLPEYEVSADNKELTLV